MNIKIELDNKSYSVDTDKGIDLSIPTDFKTGLFLISDSIANMRKTNMRVKKLCENVR